MGILGSLGRVIQREWCYRLATIQVYCAEGLAKTHVREESQLFNVAKEILYLSTCARVNLENAQEMGLKSKSLKIGPIKLELVV